MSRFRSRGDFKITSNRITGLLLTVCGSIASFPFVLDNIIRETRMHGPHSLYSLMFSVLFIIGLPSLISGLTILLLGPNMTSTSLDSTIESDISRIRHMTEFNTLYKKD